MNVLYIIGNLGAGGAEKLVCDLAVNLVKDNFSVTIVALGNYRNKDFENQRIDFLEKNGVNVFVIPKKIHSNRISTILSLREFIKHNKPNIIHTHLFTGRIYGVLSTFGMKIPIVSTYHSTSGFGRKERIASKLLKNKFVKFIAVSESVKHAVEKEFNIPSSKIVVIYNGVETEKFKLKSNVDKKEKIVFTSIGRLVEEKGFDILVDSLKILDIKSTNKYVFNIAGDGPLKDELKEKARKLHNKFKINFFGNITNIPEFLAEGDVFIAPSLYEGFGIALVEAMASSKPIIISNIDPFKEITGIKHPDFSNGFAVTPYGVIFRSQDPLALSKATKWMIKNKEKWPEFSKNSYERAKIFDISKTVEQHKKLYTTFYRKI